jgi:hypothetical protein
MTHPPGEDAGLEFDLGPLRKKALAHHVYAAIERDSLGQARRHALLRGKPRTRARLGRARSVSPAREE